MRLEVKITHKPRSTDVDDNYDHGLQTVTLKDVVSCRVMEDKELKKPEAKKMNFSEAVNALKMGDKVRRLSWPEDRHVAKIPPRAELQIGDEAAMIEYYDWNPTTNDLEATDWWVVTD